MSINIIILLLQYEVIPSLAHYDIRGSVGTYSDIQYTQAREFFMGMRANLVLTRSVVRVIFFEMHKTCTVWDSPFTQVAYTLNCWIIWFDCVGIDLLSVSGENDSGKVVKRLWTTRSKWELDHKHWRFVITDQKVLVWHKDSF